MTAKRSRRTRAELREMMMLAGKEVLLQTEPTLDFEQLTYTAVFSHLLEHHDQKVTIGSVHERIWKSQRDFQLEVVESALRDSLPLAPDEAMTRAAAVLSQADLSSPSQRRYALQSAVRQTSRRFSNPMANKTVDLADTVRFRLWALGPDHPENVGFGDVMLELRTRSTDQYVDIVRQIMHVIGVRVRPDAGDPDEAIRSIAVLGNAIGVGLHTDVIAAALAPRKLPSGPNGELEEWHNDAIALWAFVRTTFELDGDDLSDDERRL